MSALCQRSGHRGDAQREGAAGGEDGVRVSLFAKTASWGIVHVLITALVVWALTGDAAAALAIGLVEPIVQTFAYAAHERFWNRSVGSSPNGRQLILKTFSFFLVHMGVAATLVLLMTGDLWAAVTLGLIEPLVQTFAFNAHERVWASRVRRARPAVSRAAV
jgi:uncharacterized membrane protein